MINGAPVGGSYSVVKTAYRRVAALTVKVPGYIEEGENLVARNQPLPVTQLAYTHGTLARPGK